MNFSALGSNSSMSAYVSSLLAKAQGGTDGTGVQAGTKGDKLMQAASTAALATAAKGVKATAGQKQLEAKAATLSTQLQAALKAAGVKLSGNVEFSVSNGKLAIQGTEKDTTLANTFLENDTTNPSFASRLAALTEEADGLSQTIRQSAAISQAARYASQSTGVLSLYSSLLQRQDTSPAVFTLGASGGSLSYPGVLQSKA